MIWIFIRMVLFGQLVVCLRIQYKALDSITFIASIQVSGDASSKLTFLISPSLAVFDTPSISYNFVSDMAYLVSEAEQVQSWYSVHGMGFYPDWRWWIKQETQQKNGTRIQGGNWTFNLTRSGTSWIKLKIGAFHWTKLFLQKLLSIKLNHTFPRIFWYKPNQDQLK